MLNSLIFFLSVLLLSESSCKSGAHQAGDMIINKTPGRLLRSRTIPSVRLSMVIAAGPLRAGEHIRYLSGPPAAGQSATRFHTYKTHYWQHPYTNHYELLKPSTIILQRNWQTSLSISQIQLSVLPLNSWTLKWSSSVCNEGWGGGYRKERLAWGGVRHHKPVLWLNQCCHNPLTLFSLSPAHTHIHTNPLQLHCFEQIHENLMGFQ